MIRVTSLMAIVLAFQWLGSALAQSTLSNPAMPIDSLVDRLKVAKHVGLTIDERIGAYTLYLYTSEQHQRKLEELVQYRQQNEEYQAKRESLEKQMRDAEQRKDSSGELGEIRAKMHTLIQPRSPLSGQTLHEVVVVGQDYIEIQKSNDSESSTLIPFSKISRVIVLRKNPGRGDQANSGDIRSKP